MHEADIERVTGNLRVHVANGLKDQEHSHWKHELAVAVACLLLGGAGGVLIAIGWILQSR